MASGEVCVNYVDGSQLKLASSSSGGAVTFSDTHGHEMKYNHIYMYTYITCKITMQLLHSMTHCVLYIYIVVKCWENPPT